MKESIADEILEAAGWYAKDVIGRSEMTNSTNVSPTNSGEQKSVANTTINAQKIGKKIVTLKRICMTAWGTFGVLIEDGHTPFCLSLELPWLNNEPTKSCIPKGEYNCKRIVSPHFGRVFEVQNVPNRSHVLIHKGNFTTDTLGCIILGEQFEDTLNSKADKVVTSVLSSGSAFNEFMNIRLHGQDEFTLVIMEV